MTRVLVLVACAACGRIDFTQLHDGAVGLGSWGPPTIVFPSTGTDDNPTLTNDMLELYFGRNNDIYLAMRSSISDAWGAPAIVTELSTVDGDTIPEVSGDGLRIYFLSDRLGTGHEDIFMATRGARTDMWSGIVQVPELESAGLSSSPVVVDDQLALVLASDRSGNADLFTSMRASIGATWDPPLSLTEVNSSAYDSDAFMISDRLTVYFRSDRNGSADLFVASRAGVAEAFAPAVPIDELDTSNGESDPWVAPDQRTIYFTSDRGGVPSLYVSTR